MLFFERILFATLGAIREPMGGKVVPKGSQKVFKSDHFEARVDFWKLLFYWNKAIVFEVPEVSGDDLETISEMKVGKRALEGRLRVPFCRFGQIFEILRVPLGGHFGSKFWACFWFDFWSILRSILGGAGGRGGPPWAFKTWRVRQESVQGLKPFRHALYPCGVGADLKASPLPPAPLATSLLLICRLNGLAGTEKLVSRIGINW